MEVRIDLSTLTATKNLITESIQHLPELRVIKLTQQNFKFTETYIYTYTCCCCFAGMHCCLYKYV